MKRDVVSLLELAYAQDLPDEAWVGAICEAVSRCFAPGEMVFGYFYDARDGLDLRAMASTRNIEALSQWAQADLPDFGRVVPRGIMRALYEPAPRLNLASVAGRINGENRELWKRFRPSSWDGVSDVLGIRAGGIDLRGLMVAVPIFAAHTLTPRAHGALERIAAHLAAAARLRLHASDLDTAEAILDPQGRLQHASADPLAVSHRKDLARAVHRIERARTRTLRHDPEQSLELWQALVEGHWSVVDHVDTDGKRLIVARRNEPLDRTSKAISDGRRQVLALASLGYSNKLIAYELGLSPAAVSGHLKRGLAQLGLNSRQELIALTKQGHQPAAGGS